MASVFDYYLTRYDIEWENVDLAYDEEINVDLQNGLHYGYVDRERFESDEEYRREVTAAYYEGNPTLLYRFSNPKFELLHDTNTNSVRLTGEVPMWALTDNGRDTLELSYDLEPEKLSNGDTGFVLK